MSFRLITALILFSFALGANGYAWAQSAPQAGGDVSKLQVSMLGDVEMSCGQLSREAETMRDIIIRTQDARDERGMANKGISAAGALGSLIVGTATGGLGLAAAGFMAHEANSEGADQIEKIQDVAEQRRSFMVGIYNAKGCFGPIEHTMQDHTALQTMRRVEEISPASGEPGPRGFNH